MRDLVKIVLTAIGQVILDWIGFQFLDEAKRLIQSPTMAASTQGYIGLIAIIGATVLLCYLCYLIGKWVKAANHAMQEQSIPQTQPIPPSVEVTQQGITLVPCDQRPPIGQLLDDARDGSEVWVLGIDCGSWLTGYHEEMKSFVSRRNLSFIFLIADPTPKVDFKTGERIKSDWECAEGHQISHNSIHGINNSLEQLRKLKEELSKEFGPELGKEYCGKIHVRLYDLPVIHSMVVTNPEVKEIEKIQVAHYLYKVDPLKRTSLTLQRNLMTKEQQEGIFELYMTSIKHVLRNSKELKSAV